MRFTMGKRALALSSAAFAAAFVSVGFAAWYVSGPSAYEFKGNVSVEGVVGNTASVVIPEDQLNQSVSYGSPEEAAGAGNVSWLYSDGSECENLTLEYDLTFENVTPESCLILSLDVRKPAESSFSAPYGPFGYSSAGYDVALAAGYIAPVAEAEIELTDKQGVVVVNSSVKEDNSVTIIFSADQQVYSARLSITFKWGVTFDGENPYYAYKDLSSEEERLAAANTLAHIAACLEDVGYVIRFTRTTAAA